MFDIERKEENERKEKQRNDKGTNERIFLQYYRGLEKQNTTL